MLNLTFDSNGPFTKTLDKRIKAWEKRSVAFSIHTPPEIAWWYYNEFGTATQATGPARKTGRYIIRPRDPIGWLIFPWNGEMVKFRRVLHPGTKASHFTLLAQKAYRKVIRDAYKKAVEGGGLNDPEMVKTALLHSMQQTKELIAESMSRQLQQVPYHDEDGGKLKGRKAHEVYRELAQVVDHSV